MSKIRYYSDVKILKKPLKERIKSGFKIFLIVGTLVGCFAVSILFSKALTVGNVGNFLVFGDTKLKIGATKLYAVTLGEFDSSDEAEKVALGATIQGAGGYVWEDAKFFVVGNVYSSMDDASIVLDNLKNTNYSLGIKTIDYPKLNIDFSMYENADMPTIRNAFEILDDGYFTVYDYGIKFDKKEINNLAISSGLSTLRGELKSLILSIQNLINKAPSNALSTLQTGLIKLDEILDESIIKTIDNGSTSYTLKYATAHIARVKKDVFDKISG